MADCPYQRQAEGGWQCPICGDTARASAKAPRRSCVKPGEPIRKKPTMPPLHKRLANFSRAAIEHEIAGCPTCTQEQIDERHAACVRCELFLPDKDNPAIGHCCHETCGCPITQLAKFVSKLAWADQKCPLGKWPPIAP